MYVLARREGDSIIMFEGLVEIKVLSVTGKIVRLGIEAPKEIDVTRKENFKKEDKRR